MRGVKTITPADTTIKGLSGPNQTGRGFTFKRLFTRGVKPSLGYMAKEKEQAGLTNVDQVTSPALKVSVIPGRPLRVKRRRSKRLRAKAIALKRTTKRKTRKTSKTRKTRKIVKKKKKRVVRRKGIKGKGRKKEVSDIFS